MELIKVTEQNGKQAVSARELHEFLIRDAKGGQEGRMFAHWIKEKIEFLNLEEGLHYQIIEFDFLGNMIAKNGKSENQDVRVHRRDYALTLDSAKEIAMVQNNDKGKQARLYFIEVEKRFKQIPTQIDFTNPVHIMKILENWIEDRKKLEVASDTIKELTPKAEFFDAVTDSKNAVDMATCVKVLNLGIGRNTLFEFLRVKKILMDNNQPYQKYIDMGLFRVIEQKYTKPSGETNINIKTVVYQKGLDYIRRIYNDFIKEDENE